MRHGRKYPCPDKAFPGSGRRCAQGLLQAVCGAAAIPVPCPVRGRRRKMRKLRELPQRGSAARGMVPPVVAAVMDRDGLVVPVAGVRAGRHMGRRRRLAGLGPVRRWRRLPVMARRWRVVIPGVIVMHTACPQDEEPGEQDQGQDMQEPDKSGISGALRRRPRRDLPPARAAAEWGQGVLMSPRTAAGVERSMTEGRTGNQK